MNHLDPIWRMALIILGVLALSSLVVALLRRTYPEKNFSELVARVKAWWIMAGVFFGAIVVSSRISLSSQQRTRIHNVVLHRGFISRFRVTDVNFDVRVGVRVPRSFHLFVVPEDIVIIAPQFRGYRCFVFDDELVIVDAFTFEIIAIIPV